MWNPAIKEALLCSICHDVLHTPITLDCGHTFCKSCAEISGYTFCVICRIYHPVQHSTPNNLNSQNVTNSEIRTNVLIHGLVNRFRTDLSSTSGKYLKSYITYLVFKILIEYIPSS